MPVNGVLEYLWFRDHDPWWATLLRAVTLIALVVLFAFKGMHKVPSGSKALRPGSTKSSITAAMSTTAWATQSTAAVRPKSLVRV